tara:strand:+ start:457 stop:660 length:204 start_codon:yes stop_codon:yes gene_type:complete
MYTLLSIDFESDITHLINKVNNQIDVIALDTIKYKNVTEFHNLISAYNKYIEQLESKLVEATENPFC